MNFDSDEIKNVLSEKDIYKLLNDIDIDDREFKDVEVDDFKIKKLKKNLKKELKFKMSKKAKYGLGVVCGLMISVVSVGAIGVKNPSFAKNIPVLNSIVNMLNDDYRYEGQYERYAKNIGETQHDKGISITLNEAVYDETEIIITYTVKSDKKLEELGHDFMSNETITINDQLDGFSGGTSSTKLIDDHTMTILSDYSLGMDSLPDKLDIDFDINKIFNINGKWDFSFNLSREELELETKKVNTNIVKNFEGANVKISSVSFTPISTNIQLSGEKSKNLNDLNSHFGFFEYDYWLLFDDRGNEIGRRENSSGGGTSTNFKAGYRYNAVENMPKYLTVVPLQFKIKEEFGSDEKGNKLFKRNKEKNISKDVKKAIENKYPVILEQGRFGKLTINEVEESEDKTIIRYKTQGKLPYFQASQLYLESDDGEKLEQEIKPMNSGYDNKEYILEVEKLNPDKKYYFVTSNLNNRDFKEEYVFKILIE